MRRWTARYGATLTFAWRAAITVIPVPGLAGIRVRPDMSLCVRPDPSLGELSPLLFELEVKSLRFVHDPGGTGLLKHTDYVDCRLRGVRRGLRRIGGHLGCSSFQGGRELSAPSRLTDMDQRPRMLFNQRSGCCHEERTGPRRKSWEPSARPPGRRSLAHVVAWHGRLNPNIVRESMRPV